MAFDGKPDVLFNHHAISLGKENAIYVYKKNTIVTRCRSGYFGGLWRSSR
jgi:hypothetical protein